MRDDLVDLAERVLAAARQQGLRVATAESCTGGLIAACLTEVAGSSDVVDRGFVTYSNEAKSELLGVPPELIARVGAVSSDVARAMAEGALVRSHADLCVSVTGIAGPGGGSPEKPVGLVYAALARRGRLVEVARHQFSGSRSAVRESTVVSVLESVLDNLREA